MRHKVKMPVLGDTTRVVVVDEWLVEVGDSVQVGQAILSVETDKVSAEVPAPVAGRIVDKLVAPQDEVPVGAPIAIVEA
jgi:2-oxoglutarate dehydrogenase E2 component (dihydrolipoamide succinyltransferase)